MAHIPIEKVTFTESSQEFNDNDSALDRVVDPCTEFKLQFKSTVKSPNESFNLPTRKHSLISLRGKTNYKVENDLPRVHRTSSTQSVESMLRKENFRRNISESSDKTVSNYQNFDTVSMRSVSSGAFTPNADEISFNGPLSQSDLLDRLETASNISLASNFSDVQGSNVSSVSDLTGYEEEFFQIKKLVTHGSIQSLYQPEYSNNKNDVSIYENKIEDLHSQLQETLEKNEQYKFSLKDLERKIELRWQEKYQELLRQKANCEGQLEKVQKQYKRALNDKETILNSFKHSQEERSPLCVELATLQRKIDILEKHNSELNSQLALLSNESKQWQTTSAKTEAENENMRITIQEMKSELDSKNSVIFGLKNKITEQHIELQNHVQSNLKLNNHITTLNNAIEAIRKSEKWYMDQLHGCQVAKSNIQQELMSTQTNLIATNQKFEHAKIEISHWKNICEETQKKAMREKEKLLRKVEMIEADMLEREAMLKCERNETDRSDVILTSKPDDSNKRIQELEEEIDNLKKIINSNNLSVETLKKESSDYLVRVTNLQKNLNENEILKQALENRNRDLERMCNSYSEESRTKDNQLLELRNKIVSLEVALHAANRENLEIDNVVKNVREDFAKFMKLYNNVKEKLEEKTKIITQFEQERQERFMENNWRVCEIEELQYKVLDVKKLQAEILELKNAYNELLIEKDQMFVNLNERRSEIETAYNKLKNQVAFEEYSNQNRMDENLKKDILNLENEILKLNEMLNVRENQLMDQTKSFDLLCKEIEEKESIIVSCTKELAENALALENDKRKLAEIERENNNLKEKINSLNKTVIDANSVIEQFNTLCRNSETEKHNISVQLEQLKNQIFVENNLESQSSDRIERSIMNSETQTDFSVETIEIRQLIVSIKSKLAELLSENNNVSNNSAISQQSDKETNNTDTLNVIDEYLTKILSLKETQMKKFETSERNNKILRGKLATFKNKSQSKLNYLEERCVRLDRKYLEMHKIVEIISKHQWQRMKCVSTGIQTEEFNKNDQLSTLVQEVKDLKTLLRVKEMERSEQYKRFETNNRTLLRKVKEHIRGRKSAENKLNALEETYTLAITEINNLKLLTNRQEIELKTFRTRCEEYKLMCDDLNEKIVSLEKEKGQTEIKQNVSECLRCFDKEKINQELRELEYKYNIVKEKINWYEKELSDKEQGITECKKQLFNEKLQCSSLKKQASSVQMCLDNANEQLDAKQVEFAQLKSVVEKLENNEKVLTEQLESAQMQYQECKRKFDSTERLLQDKTAKDEILADEIKSLSCHLHQKTLELSSAQNKYSLLETQTFSKESNFQKSIQELQSNLSELQTELESIRNDKFFLQRLCADLKMSLQGTVNQNKVLKLRLEALEAETKDLTDRLKFDSLPNLPSPSKIDEEHINRLLKQSTVLPDKPLKNLRSCLDSLKEEMATLQKEIIAKTQTDMS